MSAELDWTHERPEHWSERGLCAQSDPEAFFPEKGGSTREAKELCNGRPARDYMPATEPCPVRTECLLDALAHGDRFGISGGMSERERRAFIKKQAAA
jgi:WhiB family redox-sensing transcriptional regulator